jgi:S1-C subfamily serine protease
MVRTNTEAIGFSIPINKARSIYEILKLGKKPTHAYFGVEVMSLSPDFARIHNEDPNANRLPERLYGAMVTRITPGSPAAQGGLRKNDVIIEVNGVPVHNVDDSDFSLDQSPPGKVTVIKVARGETGGLLELSVTPADLLQMLQEKRSRQPPVVMMKPSSLP